MPRRHRVIEPLRQEGWDETVSRQFVVPELGEGVGSAVVGKVLVRQGDTVDVDQPVVELETDKAAAEVPCDIAGIVERVHVKEGDEVKVGQTLLTLSAAEDTREQRGEPAAPPAAAPERERPPAAGRPDASEVRGRPDASDASDVSALSGQPAPARTHAPETARRPGAAPAAPSVRRFAREIGVTIDEVSGRDRHGRISMDDVKRHAQSLLSGLRKTPPPEIDLTGTDPLPDFAKWGAVRRESMSMIRRTTAEQLTRCWKHVAHVTHFDRADVTELEELRKRYADRAAKAGGKLTMAVMVVKVAASALKVFPKFNASIDMDALEIVYKDYINIGIAVATDRGLLVPVLRDVDKKNMVEIAADVSKIAERTRDGSIRLDELRGATFTVTNLGNIGGTHFTPIVNWPEVAILGMGRAHVEPGFENGVCTPRVFLPLSLSYDHRLIDGAEAARFLRWIAEAIEEPLLLSLEG
ncbi:MAG: biotin/lipoyl-binding protein [Lentisphaerae bacterium]|nr:biotin/lipoyl-binding protein [Lentisphaerota bacterium]